MDVWIIINTLTHKYWETHGCVISNVATDVSLTKHQAISIYNVN